MKAICSKNVINEPKKFENLFFLFLIIFFIFFIFDKKNLLPVIQELLKYIFNKNKFKKKKKLCLKQKSP